MERDYGKEIDNINTQLTEIKELLTNFAQKPQPKTNGTPPMRIKPVSNFHASNIDQRVVDLYDELREKTKNEDTTGFITYLGIFASGGCQSNWISNKVNTDKLLTLIESNIAAKVLTCIGNNDRLNMLLALLRAPRTVAQLVDECGYNTTGQVYHHLKPLLAADLVKEDEKNRGSYLVQPHRVQGVIMLLAGISDMIDTKYTQGDWSDREQKEA